MNTAAESSPEKTAPKPGAKPTTRELVVALEGMSLCDKPHAQVRGFAAGSQAKELRDRMADADLERAESCPECAKRLPRPVACLLLAALPPVPKGSTVVRVAQDFRGRQPMAFAAILSLDPMRLSLALDRAGVEHFTAGEYQTAAAEVLRQLAG